MEPYLKGETAGSTTYGDGDGKISGRRKAQRDRRPKAAPLSSSQTSGAMTPVTLTITYVGGSEPWYLVNYAKGKCYVLGTDSVHSIAQKLIRGGHRVIPHPERMRRLK